MTDTYNAPAAQSGTRLLTPDQAADRLRTSPATLATWRSRGRGCRYVKIGGKVYYRLEDVEAFILANVRDPAAA